MAYSDENRRYLAKVSRIGIIAAVLYALLYAATTFFPIYGIKFRFYLLIIGRNNVLPELAVIAAGVLALLVCGILSVVLREKPAVAQTGWIIAGKAVLLAAPVGFIRSRLLLREANIAGSLQLDFLFSFATLAAVFVGYAWRMRPHNSLTDNAEGVRPRRILRNTALVGGIMLVSVLWLLLMSWNSNRSLMMEDWLADQKLDYLLLMEYWFADQKLDYLLWEPLNSTLPVALAVTVGYFLLSLATRLDETPSKGRFGKGTILLGWVTLGLSVLCRAVSVLIDYRLLNYDDLMGGLGGLQKLQTWLSVLSALTALLGIWTLCGVLSRVKESKTALWGARGVLGVVVLRNLSDWVVYVVAIITQMNKDSSGMGIIGGADFTTAVLTAKVESWVNILYTLLSIAALVVLTVGLTRRCRVSKAFWAVPALTAASILTSLLVSVVWELVLRSTNTDSALTVSVVNTVITSVIIVARSLVGVLALTRTPAEEVPPPPTATEGEEPPKPRVEDYLYQL